MIETKEYKAYYGYDVMTKKVQKVWLTKEQYEKQKKAGIRIYDNQQEAEKQGRTK